MGELSKHLDLARELLGRLSGEGLDLVVAPDRGAGAVQGDRWELRCQEAERRANVAEVKVAKLKRELVETTRATSASARDIQRLAYQDPLTGLGNIHLLNELTDKLLGSTSELRQVLVIILDIDRFCVINQMLGHDLADDLLIRVGERLLELADNQAALGRLSEDEFILVVSDLPVEEANDRALALGEKIRQQMSRPFLLQGQEIFLTVSQGATLTQGQSGSARELFQQARTALTFAKQQGRDQARLYDPKLGLRLRRDAALEFQLRHALENDEFFLEYLPIIWLDRKKNGEVEGRLIGVEALLRWRHRTDGVLAPAEFLPAAERSAQIVAIGEKMLGNICRQCQEWLKSGVDLYVNINLSPRQLMNRDFVEKTIREVDEAGVSRGHLTFELQQCDRYLGEERIGVNLQALHESGFTLAINNFGEGSFSLAHLRQVEFLKLSPRLVQDTPTELCHHALAIAACLGKVAVGVGVENVETARFLINNGCPTVQGHFFSKPLAPTEVEALFHSKPSWKI